VIKEVVTDITSSITKQHLFSAIKLFETLIIIFAAVSLAG
jgi:hypothetical protein